MEDSRAETGVGVLGKLRGCVLLFMETFFQKYGEMVAKRPCVVIISCLLLTCLCGGGLYWFRMENEGVKLWIPYNSDYRQNSDWMFDNFPRDLRFNSIIFTAPNVLKADVIRAIHSVIKSVREIKTDGNATWTDMCMKRPVIKPPSLSQLFGRRRKRQSFEDDDDEFDDLFAEDESEVKVETSIMDLATQFSIDQYPTPYCDIVNGMPLACMELGLLELFGHNGEYDSATDKEISELTDEQVIQIINTKNTSGIFLTPQNFTKYLARITRDEAGNIIGAEATYIYLLGKMNMIEAKTNPVPGLGEPTEPLMFEFEGDMLKVMLNTSGYPEGMKSFPNVARSFGDIAGSTILGDVSVFVVGYVLMFAYATVMLGKISCIEHRTFLATVGIYGVIMGIIVSYGVCSFLGIFYGPMHSVMPFLMLGIGIDDMFVIMQCWDTLTEAEQRESLEKRIGFMMRQAGAAITVTSATDVIAFGIGAFTILPALKSFCLYASMGIVATFIFQASFFVAWMSIDQRRIESQRNGCFPCYVHPQSPSRAERKKSFLQKVFHKVAVILMKQPVRLTVLVFTMLTTGFGLYGNVLLRQEFDPTWFLPPDTYIAQWFATNKEYFPSSGERGVIYFSGTSFPEDIPAVQQLAKDLEMETEIIAEVDAWTGAYAEYMKRVGHSEKLKHINESFSGSLTQFLFSPLGAEYAQSFKFDKELVCGEPAGDILLSEIKFRHRLFSGPEEHVPAMNRVKELIRSSNISGKVFAMALGYATWETDEIISVEIYRNMSLGILCVFLTTLFFISNLSGAVIILLCVCLTLADVGGFMHFWGLTIDTVSCNNLIIAIGLCVDYSAHITHRFLIEHGDRKERVIKTLSNIGPAVLNGGISTFLAFVLLASSKSHVFSSFFKIFFLVVSFGLFHGLVFLPVVLSFIGPSPVHYVPVDPPEDDKAVQPPTEDKDKAEKEITSEL